MFKLIGNEVLILLLLETDLKPYVLLTAFLLKMEKLMMSFFFLYIYSVQILGRFFRN